MIDILILLLRPALVWESDPKRYWYLTPVALVATIADIIAAHSAWAVIAGWPQRGEWTISHTLERLCRTADADRMFYIQLSHKINSMSPRGDHIKAVL